MATYTLLMLEISGIQPYIFGTNNLSVNVGASTLVSDISSTWIPDCLPGRHNIGHNGKIRDAAIENDPNLDAEAIYIGGGNALLIFRNNADVKPFVRRLSARLVREAPDLRVVIKRTEIDWDHDRLVHTFNKLRTALARRKQLPVPNRPLPGLSVSATCVFTGLPATSQYRFGPPGTPLRLISNTVLTKRRYFETKANAYFNDLIEEAELAGMKPVSDFDDFGGEGNSFMAVVHADGNRMGERIQALGKEYVSPAKNRDFANKLRAFSASSQQAAFIALRHTIRLLIRQMHRDSAGQWCWQRQDISEADQQRLPKVFQKRELLPFRPVVFGGDDVTFVCDGRLGLALAQYYLQIYGQQELADGAKAVGRAGVAIVNTHYPFAQAYHLAEALAQSAKTVGDDGKFASLDWHFGVNGVLDSLGDIRATSYTVPAGPLHMRPIRLTAKDDFDHRHWGIFDRLVTAFQMQEPWRDMRSKLKGLQTALRGGPLSTSAFCTNYRLPRLPQVDNSQPDFERGGWFGGQCPYFDALEAMDFFIPLEEPA
jgi:hypothetical protein